MKKKKSWVIIAGVIVILFFVGIVVPKVFSTPNTPLVQCFRLNPGDLVNSISVKGQVESIYNANVYSTLGYTIKEVNVSVGDVVTEGQVLCVLDTEDLTLTIAQQKAELSVSEENSQNQLANNERIFQEAVQNLGSGQNSQILSMEAQVKSTQLALDSANKTYSDTLKESKDQSNQQVVNAKSSLQSAKIDLDTRKKFFENAQELFQINAESKDNLTQAENAYTTAQQRYDDAVITLDNAELAVKKALDQAERSLNAAQLNYNNAVAARDAALTAANNDLERYENAVTSSKIASNNESRKIAIQKLEKQLADSFIKSPISGTITAVYAKTGASGAGLLFVIEDIDSLKIVTTIKGYDMESLNTGMDVTIRSDATGDDIYEGKLTKIAPTSLKGANGLAAATTDIEFEAEVTVTSPSTRLKVGMDPRMNIIIEQKENILFAPFDAIQVDDKNQSYIFLAKENDKGELIAQRCNVTTGMENDFYIEIQSDTLTAGDRVVNDASAVSDGMKVTAR